jgi:hypothetical protein
MRDYFNPDTTYREKKIDSNFARKTLFPTIAKAMKKHDDWFNLRWSASGEISASPLTKCVVDV